MRTKQTLTIKLIAAIIGLAACVAFSIGIAFESFAPAVYAEGGTGTTGGLTIGGTEEVTSPDGTYTYTAADETLTLKNYNGKEIDFSGKTIKVEGNNTITVDKTSKKFVGSSYPFYAGINSRGAITITGSGSLAINVETSDVEEVCYGVYAGNGMTINGGNVSININSFYDQQSIGLVSSEGSIKVEGSATLDIKAKTGAMLIHNGDIILSGTGEKKILMNVSEDTWQCSGINAKKGVIDISGSGKVTVDFINGSKSVGIESEESAIKIHDNANVEVNGCRFGIHSRFSYGAPAVGHVGIEIKNSTVKVTSATDKSNAFSIYRQAMIIQDSVVIVDVVYMLFDYYQKDEELKILGKSTVDIRCEYPIFYDLENQVFDLKEGGSITLLGEIFKCWAKLGSGTNLETGEKGDESSTIPDCFLYSAKRYSPSNIGLLRFVYGDTSKASAVAEEGVIGGITDSAMPDTDVKITLTGDVFNSLPADMDATSWFRNLPKGLSAKAKADVAAGATEMTITVSGTPMQAKAEFVWIELPANVLQKTNYAMTVASDNLIYEIVSGEAIKIPVAITGLVYNKSEQKGIADSVAYVVVNGKETNAGKYIATIRLNSGYKWEDGTTEDKTVKWEIARCPIEVELTIEKDKYEYTGYAITPSHTVKDKVSLSKLESSEYSVSYANNKEIGTATMTVSDKDGGNYQIITPVSKTFEIVKGTKNAPEGLKGVAPTTDGGIDGKITGTTAEMEYATDTAFASPKRCTDGETTGLAEGTYYVRYKATATTEASDYTEVKIGLNSVTVTGGTGSGKYRAGASVTVKASVPAGSAFVKWSFTGIPLATAETLKEEITFAMPDNDVTLTATFEEIIYNVTVTNGTASATTAKYMTEITVTADSPEEDKTFDKWEVTGLVIDSAELLKKEITFNMPAGDVSFTAKYKPVEKYEVVVNGGTGGGVYIAGSSVTVTADTPKEGKAFDKWTAEGVELSGATSETVEFIMPSGNVTLTANYRNAEEAPSYSVNVTGGTGSGGYKEGETVLAFAVVPQGKEFVKWIVKSGNVTLTKAANGSVSFVMPSGDVEIEAVFKDKPAEDPPSPVVPEEKKGLSGGAIAAIVICSVLVAGAGGFAIFWFVIRKRNFAELIAAIKSGFKKE